MIGLQAPEQSAGMQSVGDPACPASFECISLEMHGNRYELRRVAPALFSEMAPFFLVTVNGKAVASADRFANAVDAFRAMLPDRIRRLL